MKLFVRKAFHEIFMSFQRHLLFFRCILSVCTILILTGMWGVILNIFILYFWSLWIYAIFPHLTLDTATSSIFGVLFIILYLPLFISLINYAVSFRFMFVIKLKTTRILLVLSIAIKEHLNLFSLV